MPKCETRETERERERERDCVFNSFLQTTYSCIGRFVQLLFRNNLKPLLLFPTSLPSPYPHSAQEIIPFQFLFDCLLLFCFLLLVVDDIEFVDGVFDDAIRAGRVDDGVFDAVAEKQGVDGRLVNRHE